MLLHDYDFTQVHRVRTTVTVAPSAGEAAVTRQDSFLFECFGEVVRVTGRPARPTTISPRRPKCAASGQ